ncbi:MAG TPA: methyl-accepting chemotaxis protein [Thermoguttaceae bacterium]|nr:methyl-accepting chemotaxis protein [Thermoguttaceae bacterium]
MRFSLSLKERFLAAFLAGTAATLFIAGVGYYALERSRRTARDTENLRLAGVRSMLLLSEKQIAIKLVERLLAGGRLSTKDRNELHDATAKAWNQADKAWRTYRQLPQTEDEVRLADEFAPAWNRWKDKHAELVALAQQQDDFPERKPSKNDPQTTELRQQLAETYQETLEPGRDAATILSQMTRANQDAGRRRIAAREACSRAAQTTIVLGVLLGLMTAMVLAWAMTRWINNTLSQIARALGSLAKGHFGHRLDASRDGAVAQVADAFNAAADAIQTAKTEMEEKASFHESVLDAIPHPILATDVHLNCTFFNRHAADLGGFDRRTALGKPCPWFHSGDCETERCALHQTKADGARATTECVLHALADHAFAVDAVPLRNAQGEVAGYVEMLCGVTAHKAHREYQDAQLQQLMDYLWRLDTGDLRLEMTAADDDTAGEDASRKTFAEIRRLMNHSADAMRAFVEDVDLLSLAIREGRLDVRANAAKHKGHYHRIVEGLNHAVASVAEPVRAASAVLAAMANNDFIQAIDAHWTGDYELLRGNVNTLAESVRATLTDIIETARQFDESSQLIARGAETLAHGATTQSSTVQEMSASLEQLARSIDEVKHSAAEADATARRTDSLAEYGGKAVEKSIEAMELIRAGSKQISEIIQVISEIADQTNLLALNAAIEAARAGRHGMGFAVVADEVRKLAERSNQAAAQISTLIRESNRRVEEGALLSKETGAALREIVVGVRETATRIGEIAATTVEQAANAREVSAAITIVAEVTEHAACGSEQMATSSEELGAQSNALRELVAHFRVRPTERNPVKRK